MKKVRFLSERRVLPIRVNYYAATVNNCILIFVVFTFFVIKFDQIWTGNSISEDFSFCFVLQIVLSTITEIEIISLLNS